ncbi:MAG: hypothetical protein JXA81_07890, partial [Sedimentisphaerales bacterium]|nr:hypothetical protein [Sedimentisphaerales bacterium]
MYRYSAHSRYSICKIIQIITLVIAAISLTLAPATAGQEPAEVFRAGAFAVDITPLELPVIVNGGVQERLADKVHDPLHARCLVLDDGTKQLAIVVVDNCIIPRSLADEAKALAAKDTQIPSERILISATHTHSAPSVYACLGTDCDEK